MARLEFFVVSESAAIDQSTNQLSVFNVLEQLNVPEFPGMLQKCMAVSLWQREEGEQDQDAQCTLKVVLPDGGTKEFPTNFRFSRPRHRIMQGITNIPLKCEGELRMEVVLNNSLRAQHIITVKRLQQDSTPEAGQVH